MRRLAMTNGRRQRAALRRGEGGFTLVELLTVIGILVILASLSVAAVLGVKPYIMSARIRAEMSQLEFAMGRVAAELGNGQYPPTGAGADVYWQRCFPNAQGGPPADASDPTKALVFWLSGPNGTKAMFDFDPARLKNGTYLPPNDLGSSNPYVYFGSDGEGNYAGAAGGAKPYNDTRTGKACNPRSYQLLCPGLDGKYGGNNQFPFPAGGDAASRDDLANFWTGTMESSAKQ